MIPLHEGGAQTHPERCMAMRSFPAIVHQLMEQFSRSQDVHWLKSGLEDGHFDFAQAFNAGKPDQAFKKIESAMAFLKTAHYESAPLGTIETPMTFLAFTVKDPEYFRSFFDAFVDRMVDQSSLLNPTKNIGVPWEKLRDVLGKVLLGAIAIDSVDGVEKLLDMHSSLVAQHYPTSVMGSELRDSVTHDNKTLFTPWYFAMQLGREECMRVLVKAGANLNAIGRKINEPANVNHRATESPIGLLDCAEFAPTCRRKPYQLALQQWRDGEEREDCPELETVATLHVAGLAMLAYANAKGQNVRKKAYIECFEAMEAYEHSPTDSFELACLSGRADIAERIQGKINWSRLHGRPEDGVQPEADSFIVKALKAPAPAGDSQRMGLMLMNKSLAEGSFEQVFAPIPEFNTCSHSGTGKRLAQPVSLMIDKDHMGMLLLWMKNGLDPSKAPYPECVSPVAYAEASGKDVIAHAMRTFMTRQKALSALDELDLSNTRTPSP